MERSEEEMKGLGDPLLMFEQAYAEYMAWMKNRGISAGEVVAVARRKVA